MMNLLLVSLFYVVVFNDIAQASKLTDLISGKSQAKPSNKDEYIQQLAAALQSDPSQANKDRALEASVRDVDATAVKFLLKMGANARYVSKQGKKRPLLHISLRWTSIRDGFARPDPLDQSFIINALLDAGADPSVKDSEGYTASDLAFYTKNGWRQNQAPLSAILRLFKTYPYVYEKSLADITAENRTDPAFMQTAIVADCLLDLILAEADYEAFKWLHNLNPYLVSKPDLQLVVAMLQSKSQKEIEKFITSTNPRIGMASFKLAHTLGFRGLYQTLISKNPNLLRIPISSNPLILHLTEKNPDLSTINQLIELARKSGVPLDYRGKVQGVRGVVSINYFSAAVIELMLRQPAAFEQGIESFIEGGWAKVHAIIPNKQDRSHLLRVAIVRWFREHSEIATGKDIVEALERFQKIEDALSAEPFDYINHISALKADIAKMIARIGDDFPREQFIAKFRTATHFQKLVLDTLSLKDSCEAVVAPPL